MIGVMDRPIDQPIFELDRPIGRVDPCFSHLRLHHVLMRLTNSPEVHSPSSTRDDDLDDDWWSERNARRQ